MSRARGIIFVALCATLALAACSKKTDGGAGASKTVKLSVTASESGEAYSFTGVPAEIDGGPIELSFTNSGKKEHEFAFVRVDGGKTDDQIKTEFRKIAFAEGNVVIPEYFHAIGGSPTLQPGKSATVTFNPPAGSYYYMCIIADENNKAHFDKGMYGKVAVKGGGGELPATDATISATEYSFTATGLKAGTVTVTFKNTGTQLHHALLAPLAPGKGVADVKKFFETEQGQPPVDFEKTQEAPVLDGGRGVTLTYELAAGKYALVCFLNDRAGGAPHFTKGMLQEVEVTA